jgi:hypothetical protein
MKATPFLTIAVASSAVALPLAAWALDSETATAKTAVRILRMVI